MIRLPPELLEYLSCLHEISFQKLLNSKIKIVQRVVRTYASEEAPSLTELCFCHCINEGMHKLVVARHLVERDSYFYTLNIL